ncbi:HlyD family type I secretion periplasmic adaptor subunit [Sulfitobacter sp. F26204]|uniref:HlyD family type I secretion periplasmic adaptor subunit n=1 Tax=Sulfitobacter sp. F26204 TaxID=2996014 RepID=UPI00225DF301|nr:HlyD family type I secretion periplasmic adaptor subunit [Sulfitobacter sp. F26204]MCX7558463.1 HlyD family type I secretion periplasmic adaptor subunit [Sulfitobacter sp. F26204]
MKRGAQRPDPRAGLSARPQIFTGCAAIAVLVVGVFYWGFRAAISGAVVVSGTIEGAQNRQVVQHPTGGEVAAVNVRDGQHVTAGEVLLQLDTLRQQGALAFAKAQLFELRARQQRLHAEQAGHRSVEFDAGMAARGADNPAFAEILNRQRMLFRIRQRNIDSEMIRLENRKEQIATEMQGLDARETALLRQLDLNRQELETQRSLRTRKLTSINAVIGLEREEARLQGSLGELAADRAVAAQRMIEADLELTRIVARHLESGLTTAQDLDAPIREYQRDVAALRLEIAQAKVRAPVSGIVYGMTIRAGRAVLRPAEPVLYIVPQNRGLIVALTVQPRQIDQVALGQSVKLRLSALDQEMTPEVQGRVIQMSADVITDPANGQSYYRVEMELPAAELQKLPVGVQLLPGMPVEAFIHTKAHSPMVYLVKPLADYFARAFRES